MIFVFLIITIFVYLLFPTIYYMYNGKIAEEKAKKYSLINAIVCAAIFVLIRAISGLDAVGTAGFAPAVLYYFIAKAIMSEKKETKQNTTSQNTQTQNEQPKSQEDNSNDDTQG